MMPTSHPAGRLRGFSLLEMIVVVAVLGSLLAISLPALFHPLGNSGLREAAKQVQAALLDARTRAVESGLVQEFRYEPGGRRYEIRSRPDAGAAASDSSATLGAGKLGANAAEALQFSATGTPGAADRAAPESVQDQLPDGIVFADPQETGLEATPSLAPTEVPATDDLTAAQDALEEEIAGEKWSPPLRFSADGRSGNLLLKLRDNNSWSIQLWLRGLVGTALVGQPRREETPAQESAIDR